MWGPRSGRTLAILIASVLFVALCVLPVVYLVAAAFADPQQAMRALLLDSRQTNLLYNTLLVGGGTAVLATTLGAPLGFALARFALPFKPGLRLALVAPAVLPPYVVALALVYLDPTRASTVGGAIVAMSVVFYPLVMLTTEVAVRRVEPRLEEAAALVASPLHILTRITWPLAAPSIAAAAMLTFVLAISEFSVPGLLRVRVFTTEVFSALATLYDFGRATTLTLPLLIVSAGVASIVGARIGNRLVVTRRTVGGGLNQVFNAWQPLFAAALVGVVIAALVVPVGALVREASRSPSIIDVLRDSRTAVVNSVVLAVIGATAVTALALCLGYARARVVARRGAALDACWLAMFTVPSTVMGIGLIAIWNRPTVFGEIYGTPAMLVIGYLGRFGPLAALAIAAIVRSVPESHEEAAAVAGAGWLRTMRQIVLPQLRGGLGAVWAVVFILAFGEVGTSILIAPPGESTLPIRVYTLTANAPPGHVASLALFQSVVVLCPLALLGALLARRKVL